MNGRVLRGIGANLYGQGVTVALQLATIPVLLQAWGPEACGRWVTILAWTSLLSLADGGLMVAAGTAATMAVGRGDPARAGHILDGLGRFVRHLGTGLGGLLVGGLLIPWGAPADWSGRFTVGALGLAALVSLPLGTAEVAFRAAGRYASGMALASTVRLVESAAVLAAALAGGSLTTAAGAVLLVRAAGWQAMSAQRRRQIVWSRQRRGSASPNPLSALVRPALAALALPAALACTIQGTTIAASLVLPASAVALLVAARTLCRGLVQGLGLVTHALMPEMALAAGQGDTARSARLARVNLLAAALLLGPGWLVLVTAGPALVARWTSGILDPEPVAFALLASAALAHGCWLSVANRLLAVNRQAEFAAPALLAAGAGTVLASLLGAGWGLRGVALASLAGELVLVAYLLPLEIALALRPVPAPTAAAQR